MSTRVLFWFMISYPLAILIADYTLWRTKRQTITRYARIDKVRTGLVILHFFLWSTLLTVHFVLGWP